MCVREYVNIFAHPVCALSFASSSSSDRDVVSREEEEREKEKFFTQEKGRRFLLIKREGEEEIGVLHYTKSSV